MTTTTYAVTDHPYQGSADGRFCSYDPLGPDVDFCSFPRSAHKPDDTICTGATRRHEHIGENPETGRLMLRAQLRTTRSNTWIEVPDDGSICTRDVAAPKAPSYIPGTLPHREKVSPNPTKKGSHR